MSPPADFAQGVRCACDAIGAVGRRGHLARWQARAILTEMRERGLLDGDPEMLDALGDGDRRIFDQPGEAA